MKVAIKNMVCARCIMVVRSIFEKNGLNPISVELGEVVIKENLVTEKVQTQLCSDLKAVGFDQIDSRRGAIIEKIKNAIIDLVHLNKDKKINLSDHLARTLNYDYKYLSNLFSEVESTTIEQYFISQRIEKVKELLVYDELTLSEIAYKLNYSSVAYLSSQFKKVTGLTPSFYKSLKENKRKKIEEL